MSLPTIHHPMKFLPSLTFACLYVAVVSAAFVSTADASPTQLVSESIFLP